MLTIYKPFALLLQKNNYPKILKNTSIFPQFMNRPTKCPMCSSLDIDITEVDGIYFCRCKRCPFDELDVEEDVPDWIKSRHDPYKTTFKNKKV